MFGFPSRYKQISFDRCVVTDGNREAIEAAKRWAAEGAGNLWFYGTPGSGKTHIAAAAMWEGPIGVPIFCNVAEMLLDFQASVKEHDELTIINRYSKGHTLFDDVAAHRISDFAIEMFGLLLERLYSNDIDKLIFTSNLSPKGILETMGERIASRLKGLAQPIKVEGEDWRFKK